MLEYKLDFILTILTSHVLLLQSLLFPYNALTATYAYTHIFIVYSLCECYGYSRAKRIKGVKQEHSSVAERVCSLFVSTTLHVCVCVCVCVCTCVVCVHMCVLHVHLWAYICLCKIMRIRMVNNNGFGINFQLAMLFGII